MEKAEADVGSSVYLVHGVVVFLFFLLFLTCFSGVCLSWGVRRGVGVGRVVTPNSELYRFTDEKDGMSRRGLGIGLRKRASFVAEVQFGKLTRSSLT